MPTPSLPEIMSEIATFHLIHLVPKFSDKIDSPELSQRAKELVVKYGISEKSLRYVSVHSNWEAAIDAKSNPFDSNRFDSYVVGFTHPLYAHTFAMRVNEDPLATFSARVPDVQTGLGMAGLTLVE